MTSLSISHVSVSVSVLLCILSNEMLVVIVVFAEAIGGTPTPNSKEIPTLMASVVVQVKEEVVVFSRLKVLFCCRLVSFSTVSVTTTPGKSMATPCPL